ncbi:MAG: hypothetical protein FWD47_15535, partial [Treponema sp.]|nr:hypothetical protein [Treponema sp.]
ITSFTLDISRNSQLKSNSTALIDHNARLIIIEAAYDGASPPYSLSPQFTATGNVTVNGVSQTSGSTYNNFSGAVTYTVTNPSNPTLRRDYRVEVVFVQALSSVAEITSFVFYKADNPDLIADTTATINQGTGAISARLHFETPGGNRTLIARWSSQGTVDSNGVVKYNMDQRQFYTPVNYRAVSIDGLLQKNYTVTIKEVNTRIYVRQSATGRNDGTNWDNAYVNMPNACNDAELFPDEISKEIWIAEGTYTPTDRGDPVDYLIISANTSYIGGFAGNETTVSGRTNMNNRRATITGDLGGGVRSQRFFYKNNFQGPAAFYIFEELQFTNSSIITDGSAIYLRNLNGIVSLNNLYLYNIDGLSSVISLSCLSADVRNTEFYNITFTNTQGSALYVSAPYTNGFITIDNIKIDGVTNGRGFNLHSYLTQISNSQIINCTSGGSGGGININNYRNVEISNTTIENTSAAFRGGGIYFAKTGVAGTVFSEKLNNVTFRNTVSQIDGGAIFSSGDLNTITIEGCNFYNTQAVSTYSSGGAIRSSSGNLIINNCTFNNTHASWTGGAMLVSGAASVIITNNNFINTSAGNGNAIYFTSGIPSSSVTLNNNNFNGMPNPVLWN